MEIYRVENIDRYDDRDVIITNLIDSYNRLMEFGKKLLNDLFILDGIQSVSARDRILREVVLNIIAHRDYSSGFPAKLIIEKLSRSTGRKITYDKPGYLKYRSYYIKKRGPDKGYVNVTVALYFMTRMGSAKDVKNEFYHLTGKQLRTFQDSARENIEAFVKQAEES